MVIMTVRAPAAYRTPYAKSNRRHGSGKKQKKTPKPKPPVVESPNGNRSPSIFSGQYVTLGTVLRASAIKAAAAASRNPSCTTVSSSGIGSMTATPTNGSCNFPFAVNCKLSKVWYSMPKKCSHCNKLLLFTAYACQFCRYRVHVKCAELIEQQEQEEGLQSKPNPKMPTARFPIPSRRKLCSLSKLPADEELFEKLIRENEINANDMDVFLEECSQLLARASIARQHSHQHPASGGATPMIRPPSASVGGCYSVGSPPLYYDSEGLVHDSEIDTDAFLSGDDTPRSPRRTLSNPYPGGYLGSVSDRCLSCPPSQPVSRTLLSVHSASAVRPCTASARPSLDVSGEYSGSGMVSPASSAPQPIMMHRLWALFSRFQEASAGGNVSKSKNSDQSSSNYINDTPREGTSAQLFGLSPPNTAALVAPCPTPTHPKPNYPSSIGTTVPPSSDRMSSVCGCSVYSEEPNSDIETSSYYSSNFHHPHAHNPFPNAPHHNNQYHQRNQQQFQQHHQQQYLHLHPRGVPPQAPSIQQMAPHAAYITNDPSRCQSPCSQPAGEHQPHIVGRPRQVRATSDTSDEPYSSDSGVICWGGPGAQHAPNFDPSNPDPTAVMQSCSFRDGTSHTKRSHHQHHSTPCSSKNSFNKGRMNTGKKSSLNGPPRHIETQNAPKDFLCLKLPSPPGRIRDAFQDSTGHSGISATSSLATPIRTPVDEFNESLISEICSNNVTNFNYNCSNYNANINYTDALDKKGGNVSVTPKLMESDVLRRRRNWVRHMAGDRGAQSQDCMLTDDIIPRRRLLGTNQALEDSLSTEADSSRVSSPPYDHHFSGANKEGQDCRRLSLCSTWPLAGMHLNYEDDDDNDESNFNVESNRNSSDFSNRSDDQSSMGLGEWSIPYDDLHFDQCLTEGHRTTMYKGKWHGDVLIHMYKRRTCDEAISEKRFTDMFLKEVHKLSMIRHENVVLFMGACVQYPRLAIVTGPRKGDSLFEAIHMKRRNRPMSEHTKTQISRQMAQAISYLHEKRIVVKVLSSRNVFMESKVKICLVDTPCASDAESASITPGEGCLVPRGSLHYISPELMRSLSIDMDDDRHISVTAPYTLKSDVYAFGTILYELFTGRYPCSSLPPATLVWNVGVGRLNDLVVSKYHSHRLSHFPTTILPMFWASWSYLPVDRPSMKDNYAELCSILRLSRATSNDSTKTRQSTSVPDKLNQVGKSSSSAVRDKPWFY